MASANFTDLKANVALWTQRSDLTAVIPDMIILAEKKINRALLDMNMETSVTTSPLTETTALPTDFVSVRSYVVTYSGTVYQPDFITADEMDRRRSTSPTTTGVPDCYTIRRGYIEVLPSPGYTMTSTLVYILRVVPLATTATNWLLTDHFDVYLYGTLKEVYAYAHNEPEELKNKALFDEALKDVKAYNAGRKYVKRSMSLDTTMPGMRGGSYSIESG